MKNIAALKMSNDNENYSIAGRYRTVRKHLDALGYKQALSLDSLPLIELLLVDLAQTKESLKHFQSIAKDNLEACSQLQLAVDPYKCDNARLVQECNQIHLELIEAKETNQKQSNDYKKRIRKLESELSDLQLSFSKNLQRIKQLENESSNKSKKILELQGKCCKPVVNNVNLATKKRACYPLRRPVLETEPYPRTTSSSTTFSTRSVEPYVVDFVSMADHRISCLNNEVTKMKEELFLSNEHIETLKSQLNTKEKEMSRLRKMLEGGRPCASINKDHCCLKSENVNGFPRNSDNEDLLSLQQAKCILEQQLKEALNKQHDAMSKAMKLAERNEELEKELKDVDRIALAVEADCNSTVKENNRRVCRLQEKLEDLMTQVHVLESELTVQRREAQELRADLEACRLEKSNVQRVLETTLEEKKQMTDRINNLTIMASKSPDKTNGYQEKKKESTQSYQERKRELTQSNKQKECAFQKNAVDEGSQCNIDRVVHEKNVIIESLQNTIERIETERDHYKSEYSKLKDQFKKDTEKDNEGMWSEICELRAQISEKEHTISKLIREKKELCTEKFHLENKLHTYQSQQQRRSTSPCRFCRGRSSPMHNMINGSGSNKLDRLERERDSARADVERLIEERDSLRERLKGSRRAALNGLDDQLEDVKDELRRTKQELTEQRTQYFQLRALQDQTDQALGDVQGQLTQCENELSGALDRNKNLERQQLQLDNQMKELRQEINTHRSRMAQLDREKDQLLMDLDEKTEKIAALERELVFKEQQANGMENQIRELSHTKQICIDQAADMDRQMRSMQLDLDNLHRQLTAAGIDRDNAVHENRRMQDDLAAVSCEVRNMHKELEASKAEAHDLKRQLQTYVSEVRRAEDLLSQKENERTEMLNHFRSLSLEATVLENNNHSLETEAAEARGALQSARDQIMDLERQLSDKDCLIRGYEAQITELTQNVASLEIQLQQATDQRLSTEEDLRTVRDLCMTLEQQKDCISQRLDQNAELKTKYELQIARYRSEQDIFQDQMNKDHLTIDHLEKLLEEARKETMTSQTNSRELQTEVSRLKQKISELQNKLSSETTELRKYQTQAAEYSKQISELRRQVTNERFERARMQEESRSKALVPKNQRKCSRQSNKAACNSCARMSSGSGNEVVKPDNFKLRITEVTSSSSETCTNKKNGCCKVNNNLGNCCSQKRQHSAQNGNFLSKKNSLYNVNYQQDRVCFCASKAKIGDLIAQTKTNTNNECKRVSIQNDIYKKNLNCKPLMSSDAFSETSAQCGRCGGKKKLRQHGFSPYWMVETLNLMNNLIEEKRKARSKKCADDRSCCSTVAIQATKQTVQVTEDSKCDDRKLNENIMTKEQSIKYSLIEACTSNCTVSTQTLESIVAVTDVTKPHLVKILTDIQLYAKNIQNYFQSMNETMKQNNYTDLDQKTEQEQIEQKLHQQLQLQLEQQQQELLEYPPHDKSVKKKREQLQKSLRQQQQLEKSQLDQSQRQQNQDLEQSRKEQLEQSRQGRKLLTQSQQLEQSRQSQKQLQQQQDVDESLEEEEDDQDQSSQDEQEQIEPQKQDQTQMQQKNKTRQRFNTPAPDVSYIPSEDFPVSEEANTYPDQSLPSEELSINPFDDEGTELDMSSLEDEHFASTPRSSEIRLNSNDDETQMLSLPVRIESKGRLSQLDTMDQLGLQKALEDADLESTTYTSVRPPVRPSVQRRLSSGERTTTNESTALENVREQVNENVDAIQEKIEELRQNVLMDLAENRYQLDKNQEKNRK